MTDENQNKLKPIINQATRTSWWQYFLAGNRTAGGSMVMLVVGIVVGFGWGYYIKYKSFKSDGAEIVNQSVNNERLDLSSSLAMERRANELTETLKSIGHTASEIEFLLNGNVSTLDKFKDKFNQIRSDAELYTPREDCHDDYLGREASDKVNQFIQERFAKKTEW